jgi:hypothetical protein
MEDRSNIAKRDSDGGLTEIFAAPIILGDFLKPAGCGFPADLSLL